MKKQNNKILQQKLNLLNLLDLLEIKYKNRKISFRELFNFKYENNFYSKKDIDQFWKYLIKWKKLIKNNSISLINYLQKEIPNNEYFKDWKKIFIIDKKQNKQKIKNLDFKKRFEYWQLFNFWGRNSKGIELTREEIIEYWNLIKKESNSEWDFFNKKDKSEIEISDLTNAGGDLSRKIQRKYDSNQQQLLSESEIFQKSKNIILKKLEKETKNNSEINILSFAINCYSKGDYVEASNSVFKTIPNILDDKNGEYMKINKYHEIIEWKSKNEYMNIKNGFISFWYGKSAFGSSFKRIRVYQIKNFYLNYKKYLDFRFDNEIYFWKFIQTENGNLDEQMKIFIDRSHNKKV